MKMRKILALVLAATTALALTACGSAAASAAPAADGSAPAPAATAEGDARAIKDPAQGDEVKIAYIPISTAGVTNEINDLAFRRIAESYGDGTSVKIDFMDAGYDPQTQITMVNDAVNQGYDVIIVECADPVSLSTPIAEAEAAGVAVLSMNLNCDATHTLQIRGVDYLAGYVACEQLIDIYGADSGIGVIMLDCPAFATSTNKQCEGFADCMEEKTNWTEVDHQYIDNFSQEIANTTMRDLLTKYGEGDADVVFGMMADISMGAVQAIDAAGRTDIKVWGNIGSPALFNEMKNGKGTLIGFTYADCYQEAAMLMNFAIYYAMTGTNSVSANYGATPEILLGVTPVTADNLEEVLTQSFWKDTKAGQDLK